MSMFELNLLPPREKANLEYEMKTRAVVAVATWLGAVLLIFTALLLPTIFLLSFQKAEVLRAVKLELASQEQAGVTSQVKRLGEINRLAGVIVRHERESAQFFALFEALFRDVPSTVRLQSVKLQSASKEVAIEGFAPTRASLLEFIATLQADPRLLRASSPVANLIKETDIKFSIIATVK